MTIEAAHLLVDFAADLLADRYPSGHVLRLEGDGLLIGRLPPCQVQLNLREVSRQHAQIGLDGSRFFVADLGSTNGTFVNGKPLAPHQRHLLSDGDLVQVASVLVLRFVDATGTMPITTPQPYLSGRFWLDRGHQQVYVNRKRVEPGLSAQQFRLLETLAAAGGQIVSRDTVAASIWPEAHGEVSEAMIDNLVKRVRQRLAAADAGRDYIETVRGVGFRLRT